MPREGPGGTSTWIWLTGLTAEVSRITPDTPCSYCRVHAGAEDPAEPPREERGGTRFGDGLSNATLQQRLVPVRLFTTFS